MEEGYGWIITVKQTISDITGFFFHFRISLNTVALQLTLQFKTVGGGCVLIQRSLALSNFIGCNYLKTELWFAGACLAENNLRTSSLFQVFIESFLAWALKVSCSNHSPSLQK